MPWQRPTIVICRTEAQPDRIRLHCEFTEPLPEPAAPASLWDDPSKGQPVFDLHRVAKRKDRLVIFETFPSEARVAPTEGHTLYIQAHWLPQAMKAALDTAAAWKHCRYPDDGNHSHCLFTWETIASYAETAEGYWSEEYGWTTRRAYEDYIVKDIYHLREPSDA